MSRQPASWAGCGRRWVPVLVLLVALLGMAAACAPEPPDRPPTTPPVTGPPAGTPRPGPPGTPTVPGLSDVPDVPDVPDVWSPPSPSGRPRIFFSEGDLPRLREKARTTHREIWEPILTFANGERNSPVPTMPAEGDLTGFRNAGNRLVALAFAYVITEDHAYLELARRDMLTYAEWPYWGDETGYGNRDLGFHHMLLGSSLAYDWLYSALSPDDRATIRNALVFRAQESYEASSMSSFEYNNWWRQAYTQNHSWTNHSALGIAALVLSGEDDRAAEWLNHAVERMSRISGLLDGVGDGSWHEGMGYQTYGLTMSLPFYHNLKRLRGQDILPHRYLENYTQWRLYNNLPQTRRFLFSHSNMDWDWVHAYVPQGILRFAAREYRDRHAEWVAQQISAENGRFADIFHAPWYVFEFLYYDPGVPAQPPHGLPTNRVFPDLGAVVWRTGWGDQDLVFGLKAGPPGGRYAFDRFLAQEPPFDPRSRLDIFHAGHDHADTNSFYLYQGGGELSVELNGVGLRDSRHHNTLLVDGQGQYMPPATPDPAYVRDTDSWLEAVEWTDRFAYLIADATRRYRDTRSDGRPGDGKLREFRRFVIFSKPDYLVMVDRVRASSPRDFDWVAHFPSSVSVESGWIRGTGDNNRLLGIRVVEPQGFTSSTGDDGKPYVRIRPSSRVQDVTFVTLLYPTDSAGWNRRPDISSLGSDNQVSGVRVALEGTQDHLVNHGNGGAARLADYAFEGRVASIVKGSDGELERVFLGGGTSLADGGGSRQLISAPSPLFALEVAYQGSQLSMFGGEITPGTRVYAPGADTAAVTFNGRPVETSRDGDHVVLR
jgi:hypothetical protein